MARANDKSTPITFTVPGQRGEPLATSATRGGPAGAGAGPGAALPGQVKGSVIVGTQRDAGALVRLQAVPGEDIVALHIENGPVLLLHPETARTLMQGPTSTSSASQRGGGGGGDEVLVQAELHWPGMNSAAGSAPNARGLADIGRVIVSAFQVLTGLVKEPAANFAAGQIVKRVDAQVDAGVYALQAGALDKLKGSPHKLATVPATANNQPILVLVHGSFVETTSTFGKLWLKHPGAVQALFKSYADAVYALDHPTLGASPIANARTLVDALPNGARLHLLTHSRGGLVAEVLARLAGQQGATAADLAFFADAAYADQRKELSDLGALIKAKGIQVERVVRVACPARGTLLASGRLDAYVSVLKWTLELTGLVVVPAFVDFIGEVARRRADPAEIPGLAAMIPDTPLVNWLNAAPQPIPGDLRVVSGDLEAGTSIGSWLKALLADAYYWTDNDIVVHTRSMYGGAPRAGGASFLLDKSAQANHFSYFANDKTAQGVVDALTQKEVPAAFKTIGPLSWAGEDASGERGARARAARRAATRSAADASKPAVFVLPGILGSNLKQGPADDADRIWLSPRLIGNFDRLAYAPKGADLVSEDGPIGLVYDDLLAFLDSTHEVTPFGYDWRCPLQESAQRLAGKINEALDARAKTGQPVRILAHSMGGLLARTVQIVEPKTWQRLMAHADARLVTLGTPHGGSWAPMQVLSGDDGFGNILAALGSPFANRKARSLMAAMPGFLQLQAGLLNPQLKLDQARTWQAMARTDYEREQQKNWWHRYAGEMMQAAYEWGVPSQAVLDQAKALRQQLDAQLEDVLKTDIKKLVQVVGHDELTPVGFELAPDGEEGLVYLNEPNTGDGRVPLASALLPGMRTWTLNCDHGKLPSAKSAFEAFEELLMTGETKLLPPLATARGTEAAPVALVRNRPSRQASHVSPTADMQELLGEGASRRAGAGPGAIAVPALQITVLNGDLSFVSQPLMLGHYESLELTGTEWVVNQHLGDAMRMALQAGLYAGAPGTHAIFLNTRGNAQDPLQMPKPKAAIVVGLGEEGALTTRLLEMSVCQAAKAWAQRWREENAGADESGGGIELAATLIGSGGLGISASGTARAIARGVWQANRRLAIDAGAATYWPRIRKLTLVELYLDRATDAWHGLQVLAQSDPVAYVLASTISSGSNPMRRQPHTGYRGADYDLIRTNTSTDGTVSYALDTRRARTEVLAQRTQLNLLKKLVERAATARNSDADLGRALFRLLVPLELQPFMSGNDRLVLQLDAGTAPIPWELLDTRVEGTSADDDANNVPWAIRTKLLRKLAIDDIPNTPRDANADDSVLVIGEPEIKDDNYPALPGARAEALAVVARLSGDGGIDAGLLEVQINTPFDKILLALLARPYRIVHVAGHGEPFKLDDQGKMTSEGGVVLSEGVFLSGLEIEKLPAIPELVFVNCCHLGEMDAAQLLKHQPHEPVAFAANLAQVLIRQGVRCVVAAGWAVDDVPAKVFAKTFYDQLLRGATFVDAVAQARQETFKDAPNSKTWAAYQCYGDPNWVFRRRAGDAQAATRKPGGEFEGIASAPDLALVLENLAVGENAYVAKNAKDREDRRVNTRKKLESLEARYRSTWASVGAVAEAFAVAWVAVAKIDKAIEWYEAALRTNDASASFKVQEQLGNWQVRQAWTLASAEGAGRPDRAAARGVIETALKPLQALATSQPTLERWSLCGSAFKRLGQLEMLDGKTQASAIAFEQAAQAYAKAESWGYANKDGGAFYPGMNRMALQWVAAQMNKSKWAGFDAKTQTQLKQNLQRAHETRPDFFNTAASTELIFVEAVAAGKLGASAECLCRAFRQLQERVAEPAKWKSVADQARFVLDAYQPAGAAEKNAAARVLALLRGYAH
jgi:CHAT domain/Lecithin:cholesterol acyltransferase